MIEARIHLRSKLRENFCVRVPQLGGVNRAFWGLLRCGQAGKSSFDSAGLNQVELLKVIDTPPQT